MAERAVGDCSILLPDRCLESSLPALLVSSWCLHNCLLPLPSNSPSRGLPFFDGVWQPGQPTLLFLHLWAWFASTTTSAVAADTTKDFWDEMTLNTFISPFLLATKEKKKQLAGLSRHDLLPSESSMISSTRHLSRSSLLWNVYLPWTSGCLAFSSSSRDIIILDIFPKAARTTYRISQMYLYMPRLQHMRNGTVRTRCLTFSDA